MTDESEDLPVIEFVAPMPGFPRHRHFLLVRVDDDGLLFALTAIENPELRFLVGPPAPFFPDYAPEVPDEVVDLLEITDAEDVVLLLVITVGETPAESTANQLAPILINKVNRRALQVVLTGTELPVQVSLVNAA